MDAALIDNGVVVQVTRDADEVPQGWVGFADERPVCGQLWDGASLTDPSPTPRAPAPITDRQFAHELWKGEELITGTEARAFVKTGAIPAQLDQVIDSLPLTDEQKEEVRFVVEGAQTFRFDHPYTQTLMAGFGWSEEKGRSFFAAAALRE